MKKRISFTKELKEINLNPTQPSLTPSSSVRKVDDWEYFVITKWFEGRCLDFAGVVGGSHSNGESESEVAQLSPTLCNPTVCSLPGSSIHGIFQTRVLEWGVISFSRGSSWPWDWTRVSCIAGRRFTVWTTREAPSNGILWYFAGIERLFSKSSLSC